jgi:hypothetical protein
MTITIALWTTWMKQPMGQRWQTNWFIHVVKYDYLYHQIDRNADDASVCNFSCVPSLDDSLTGHEPILVNDSMLTYIAETVDTSSCCSTEARCVPSKLLFCDRVAWSHSSSTLPGTTGSCTTLYISTHWLHSVTFYSCCPTQNKHHFVEAPNQPSTGSVPVLNHKSVYLLALSIPEKDCLYPLFFLEYSNICNECIG